MTDIGSIRFTIEADSSDLREADAAVDKFSSTTKRAEKTNSSLTKSSSKVSKAFKLQKGATQQVGFQIQDFAVQVANGQSAMVAFGQQGSQLAGLLGPGGAMVGAFIAIASAIGGVFMTSLGMAKDEVAEFRDEIEGIIGQTQLEKMNKLNKLIDHQESAVKKARSQYSSLINELNRRERLEERIGVHAAHNISIYADEQEVQEQLAKIKNNANESELRLRQQIIIEEERLLKLEEELGKVQDETSKDYISQVKKREAAINSVVQSLEFEAETIGKSKAQIVEKQLAELKASDAQIQRAMTAVELIEKEEQAIKDANEARRESQRLESIRKQLDPEFASQSRLDKQLKAIDQLNIASSEKERLREEAFRQHQERMAAIADQGAQDQKETFLSSFEQQMITMDQFAMSTANTFTSTFGNAVESIIFDFQSLEDAGKTMLKAILRGTINTLGQMAAQWLVYKAVQMATGTATASAAAASMTLEAAASQQLAAINAFASTAAIPIVGPAAAPAAAAAALAATTPFVGAVASLASGMAATAGQRAFGGQVGAGNSYLVGERGPEVLTMGSMSGAITPNHRLNQGGSEKITIINQTSAPIGMVKEERISANERAIIIQEAKESFAQDMNNPNSRVSRSVSRNTTARRSR